MDLNDIELEWLTNHLGHSIRIHKDFYRNQTPSIELGRIAKMLLAVDKGICLKQSEEAFFDVCDTDDETIAEEGTDTNIEEEMDTNTNEEKDANIEEQSIDAVGSESDMRTDGEDSSSEDEENTKRVSSGMGNQSKRRRVSTKSTPWTDEENRAIIRQLSEWIYTIKQAPKKEACERAQQNEPVLQNRSWYKIKWKVYNLIQADKRKAMP